MSENKFANWYRECVPALTNSANAPDLVLLHGWGTSSEIFRPWLALLRIRCNVILLDLPGFGRSPAQPGLSVDELLAQLREMIPARAALLGWSLGGAIALAFLRRFPDHCAALMTIACNPCFVANEDWPSAMPRELFEGFQAQLARNPQPTLQRFLALQVKDGDKERYWLRWLRQLPIENNTEALIWGLQLLAQFDMRASLRQCAAPGVHLFGSADALVPGAAAERVSALAPQHWAVLIDGAAHLPFASHAELCWQHLDRLLAAAKLLPHSQRLQREKNAVATAFSRAATSYDGAADLQRRVAAKLLACGDFSTSETVLDLGCGTGAISAQLASQYNVIALDLAQGMVQFARDQNSAERITWLCADAENLPLADASVDATFSSLALQWCENLGAVFFEIARVLRAGGTAVVSTLGPDTLSELRAAWHSVDGRVHVNQFLSRDAVRTAIERAGLTVISWREENEVMRYRELREFTRELKALGAHNVNIGRPDGLTSRERLQRLSAAYDAQRDSEGLLPATYQVWYLQLVKTTAR